jgi:hypothetical protein
MKTMVDSPEVALAAPPPSQSIRARDWDRLPDPVVTCFRRVLAYGEPPVTSLRIQQEGEILVGGRWRPFTATHEMSAGPPSFCWDARVRLAPLVYARVRDTLVDGVGSMEARVGVIKLASAQGGSAIDAAALHRYLAEAVWMPAALLPRFGVAWRPVDDDRAVATLPQERATVSLEFTFNRLGEVTRIFTPVRWRAVKNGFEPTPWQGTLTSYEPRCGMWVPIEAEVSWQIDGVWQPCWRGRNVKWDRA